MTERPDTRPLFMIGVAAELAGMHPQTLRVYERRGLVRPQRTARNTRLYSQADVDRLTYIQELSEAGMSLAGIERVLELERLLRRAERRIASLEQELAATVRRAESEIESARRSQRAEIVFVGRSTGALVPRYRPAVDRR